MKGVAALGIAMFAAVAAAAAAVAPDDRASLEETALRFIEAIRRKFAEEGIPQLGVPPLDPLNVTERYIRLDYPNIVDMKMLFKDVRGENLLGFNVTDIKVTMFPMSANVSAEWRPITVEGVYDVSGNVINVIPVYGNGNFRGNFNGTYFSTFVELEPRGEEVRVRKFELDFGLDKMTLCIDNFLGGVLGEIICQLMSENFPTMIEQFKIGYIEYVKAFLVDVANAILEGKTVDDILEFIEGLMPPPSTTTTTMPSPA